MPGLASAQSKPSVPPAPVQLAPQETSLSPATLTHLPLGHCASCVQWQLCPDAVQPPPAALQPPAAHELVAMDVAQPAATPTHAPLQRTNPLLHTKVHALSTHVASALPIVAAQG